MRLGRTLIIIAVLLIVVLGLVYLATTFFGIGGDSVDTAATAAAQTLRTVVALSQPASAGDLITTDMLITTEIQANEYNDLMFIDKAQIVGLYARSNYEFGQILSSTMMLTDPTQLLDELHSGHAAIIPAGMVAIEIPISRFSGMAYGLTQGDRVNVIGTMSFVDLDTQYQTILPNYLAGVVAPGENLIATTNTSGLEDGATVNTQITSGEGTIDNLVAQTASGDRISIEGRAELDTLLNVPIYIVPSEQGQRPRFVSQTVLFNRVILHVGNFPLLDSQGNLIPLDDLEPVVEEVPEGEEPPPPEVPDQPDIITLVVTPQEAVTLNYMLYAGVELTLALRPPGDVDTAPTDAVDLQYMMNVYRIPLPSQLPYGFEPPSYELKEPVLLNDIP
ncbi:MAG: hypothetical protein HOC26_09210 [Chloroflexi bacterium]|nr:hypothetical protein [Chloroflexota bacterium]